MFILKKKKKSFCILGLQGIKNKNKLILRLMEQLVYPNPAAYRDQLIRFSALNHTNYSQVCSYTDFLVILSVQQLVYELKLAT